MTGPPAAPDVTVVVPTLDEAENVDPLLTGILGAADGLALEVIVVDGGSSDGTPDRVRAWESRGPVRLLGPMREGGLSGAVLAGAAAARAPIVVVMDADGSHPPARVADLARAVLEDRCDVAIGSRYVRGGRTVGWPFRRKVSSWLAGLPARVLAAARDPMSGFFAMRTSRLLELGRGATGFKILLEVLARGGAGLRIRETPIVFRERERGRSKLTSGVAATYARQVLRLAAAAVARGDALSPAAAAAALGVVHAALRRCDADAVTAHAGATAAAAAVLALLPFGRGGPRPVRDAAAAVRFAVVAAAAGAAGVLVFPAAGDDGPGATLGAVLVTSSALAFGTALHVRR